MRWGLLARGGTSISVELQGEEGCQRTISEQKKKITVIGK
jgi:hypothetical protein